jgi:serine protease Do
MGLPKAQGALVTGVETGAPADKAGVEAGDIIVKFVGKAVEKSSDLPRIVGGIKPGTKSTVTVFRRGSTKDLAVTVAEIEADAAPSKGRDAPDTKPKGVTGQVYGLVVSDLPEAQKKELKIKSGVRIDAATEGAARAGLRDGDVIIAVGNTEVASVRELEAVLAKHDKKKSLNVLYRRGDWTQFAVIRPGN